MVNSGLGNGLVGFGSAQSLGQRTSWVLPLSTVRIRVLNRLSMRLPTKIPVSS